MCLDNNCELTKLNVLVLLEKLFKMLKSETPEKKLYTKETNSCVNVNKMSCTLNRVFNRKNKIHLKQKAIFF